MPQHLEYIDAIARQKGRDVLLLHFPGEESDVSELEPDAPEEETSTLLSGLFVDWENLPIRKQVIAWLEANGITWQACGWVADENLMSSYMGQIYVDVPFDTEDPVYQRLQAYLETSDGTMKFKGVQFCYLNLATAMKNAHHDEPGSWERWAERF